MIPIKNLSHISRTLICCGILAASSIISGCASLLYQKDIPSQNYYVESIPIASQQSYLIARKNITRTFHADPSSLFGEWKIFFLELTPLGFIGPLFNYPKKETIYEGTLSVKSEFPIATQLQEPIRAPQGVTTSLTVNFNEDFQGKLGTTGKAVKYTPESVTISFQCMNDTCSASIVPPIIQPDGTISVSSQTVVNADRVRAWEQAEAARVKPLKEAQESLEQFKREKCFAFWTGTSIVQKLDDNSYEVASGGGRHVLLNTTQTRFDSAGNFSWQGFYVQFRGFKNVVMNNGFTKKTSVYLEAPQCKRLASHINPDELSVLLTWWSPEQRP